MANYLCITRDPLDVGAINGMVCHESCGAVALFVGTTRDTFEGKEVRSLEYEAYESMAKKELEGLCIDLRARWPDIVNMAIYHRLGLVAPKEASVVIAIATPHRQASLEAVSYAIEQLKRNVPIWKKELYGDGDAEWKQNKEAFCFSKSKINADIPIPKELVQIAAEKSEVKNRIACFLSKKREEIDQNNIIDYSDPNNIESQVESCARVNSVLVKQENSKCHLKVCRVKNTEGPQTRPNYLGAIDKLMTNESEISVDTKKEPKSEKRNDVGTVEQKRIETIEQHLFQSTKSHLPVNKRLKEIEDRLLRLESISPEYWHFMVDGNSSAKNSSDNGATSYNPVHVKHENDNKVANHKVHKYTVNEINNLIQEIQNCNNKESSN